MEKGKNISRQKVEKRSTLRLDDEMATELCSSKAHRTKCTAKYRKPCIPRSSLKKEVLHPRAVNLKWMGSLNIVGTRFNDIYGEFYARIARIISDREKLLCELDDKKVKIKVRPHRIRWPDKFKVDSPSAVDILFHVLPSKCDRSVKSYYALLNFINVNDVSLQSSMAGAKLLILSSKHLSVDSERSDRPPYLWGIACFKGVKSSNPSTGKVQHRDHVSSSEYRKKGDSDKKRESDYHANRPQNINASRRRSEVLNPSTRRVVLPEWKVNEHIVVAGDSDKKRRSEYHANRPQNINASRRRSEVLHPSTRRVVLPEWKANEYIVVAGDSDKEQGSEYYATHRQKINASRRRLEVLNPSTRRVVLPEWKANEHIVVAGDSDKERRSEYHANRRQNINASRRRPEVLNPSTRRVVLPEGKANEHIVVAGDSDEERGSEYLANRRQDINAFRRRLEVLLPYKKRKLSP